MKRTGTVDIRHFYMRRTLRIFPAYFVFLGATAMAALLGIISVSWPQLRQAFLYLSNYAVLTTSRPYLDQPLGHTWSLAVEEQFYLLWPTVLLLVGLRRARWVTAAAFLLSPAIMLIEKRSPTMHNGLGVTFETIAYALAAGCFLALIWEDLPRSPLFRRFSELRWSVTLLLPVLALPLFIERARTHSSIVEDLWPFVGPMLTLVITGLLAWCVVNYDTGLGRLLNSRPLLYVGGLSYSLYLWQQPFLLGHDFGGVAQRFPLNHLLATRHSHRRKRQCHGES
jgi:peptidoglycan/LPS O-acetylase OafA/YrhL